MVVLNRIYTRTGDDGTTSLGSGARRKKYDLRVDAYGTLDEVNAVLGLARLHTAGDAMLDAALGRIQNDLFDLEADLCLSEKGPGGARLTVTEAQVAWLEEATRLAAAAICDPPPSRPLDPPAEPGSHVSFRGGRGRTRYLADIERSHAELAAGESYEVCLTDQISTDASPDPFALYRRLRRSNPSPFAAFLRFGDTAIVSSSPERFLSVGRDGAVQARPIKGTISRAEDPAEDAARRAELAADEKTRAEHLMIVDLLRNDLGRVSEVDSVRVPDLMVVEPYATVHQVVSTVTGQLEEGRSPVECVRNCFPGGSMTGAPKERTMEIIDELEDEARGVYSGAIGYFGVDGAVDLSIVIRTIVIRSGRTTIGAGGAIVMQSDPEEEFDEILLKARAPMAAIARTVSGRTDEDAWSVELEPNARSGVGRAASGGARVGARSAEAA